MASLLTTLEAARRIGVTERHIRNLARGGALARVANNAIDESSLERYLAIHLGRVRRAWAEATAWQALALVAGVEVETIGSSQRSRVRSTLRSMAAEQFVLAVRNRAHTERFVGHRPSVARIRAEDEFVTSGVESAKLGLTASTDQLDGYTSAQGVASIAARYHLERDSTRADAALIRVVSTVDVAAVRDIASAGDLLAAVALAESLDPRERAVGHAHIAAALRAFQDDR